MIVKICGITNPEDAMAAAEAGATALGLNFHPASPRFLTLTQAEAIVEAIPGSVLKVGVFVNEAAVRVAEVAQRLGLDVVQLYGEEVEYPAGLRVWRALRVHPGWERSLLNDPRAEAFVLDAAPAGVWGGSGRQFDWRLARDAGTRIIVAGGLDESNVGEAIRVARPWGVDACSRLELAPGRKDHARVKRFVEEALVAAAALRGEKPC
ncbi:MAG: phosphoribosylanthranilate isomerase [Bryobacteraceae bacterium]